MGIELTAEELKRAEACIPVPKTRKAAITPGSLVYWLWHHPRLIRRDGVRAHIEAWVGQRQFHRALARYTAPKKEPTGQPLAVSLLAGRKHASLAAVALLSLAKSSSRPVHPVVHDDGSLGPEDKERLERLFPATRFVSAEETREVLDRILPEKNFPFLRRTRSGFLLFRKIIDVHIVGAGWKIFMDSDVFFFREPQQLLSAFDSRRWVHMVDCQQSYGCSLALLGIAAGAAVHPQLNSGLMVLSSDQIDWDFLENAVSTILAKEGFSYYLEQALYSVLMARMRAEPLEATQYLVNPTEYQAREQREIAHHFVDRSILHLYRFGWQKVLGSPSC